MRSRSIQVLAAAALCFGTQAVADKTDPLAVLPADTMLKCTLDKSTFDESWVHLSFPPNTPASWLVGNKPIGPFYDTDSGMVYIFPTNSPAFTDDLGGNYADESTNCAFFKWSSQMFLWLTSTVTDEVCSTESCIKNAQPASDSNYVFASEFFYRVEGSGDNKSLVPQGAGGPGTTAAVRGAKADEAVDSVAQAGSSGVLFLEPASGATSDGTEPLVYYSVHTNRPYGYVRAAQIENASSFEEFPANHQDICQALIYGFLNKYDDTKGLQGVLSAVFLLSFCADVVVDDIEKIILALSGGIEPGPVINALKSGDTDALQPLAEQVTAQGGIGIPTVEMAIDYLSMTMELKAAWVPTWALSDTSGYLVHNATVPTYTKQTNGSWMETGTKETEVALVGLHVVGSVKGHPEMIWATFEHYKNAANMAFPYLNTSGDMAIFSDFLANPDVDWLFSDGTFAGVNQEYAEFAQQKDGAGNTVNRILPMPYASRDFSDPGNISTSNYPMGTATNVIRLSPWGNIDAASNAAINSEVISNNLQVLAQMRDYYASVGVTNSVDPRLNYILTGSSWGTKGAFPTFSDMPLTKNISGTAAMENATLETFTQTYTHGDGVEYMNTSGCFSCHAVSKSSEDTPGWKFDVSHIFSNIQTVEKNQ